MANIRPSIEPWETPLVPGCQFDFEPLTMTLSCRQQGSEVLVFLHQLSDPKEL